MRILDENNIEIFDLEAYFELNLAFFVKILVFDKYLNFGDETYDMTLLLGPMYHLFTTAEQKQAMAEATEAARRQGKALASQLQPVSSSTSTLTPNISAFNLFKARISPAPPDSRILSMDGFPKLS